MAIFSSPPVTPARSTKSTGPRASPVAPERETVRFHHGRREQFLLAARRRGRTPTACSRSSTTAHHPQRRSSLAACSYSWTPRRKHVSLKQAYVNPAGFIAANQGSVQRLADGRVFVGWGNQPYFSEFAADGALLMDGQLPLNVQSYRAFTYDWTGKPSEPPHGRRPGQPGRRVHCVCELERGDRGAEVDGPGRECRVEVATRRLSGLGRLRDRQ